MSRPKESALADGWAIALAQLALSLEPNEAIADEWSAIGKLSGG